MHFSSLVEFDVVICFNIFFVHIVYFYFVDKIWIYCLLYWYLQTISIWTSFIEES